jgi:uncharacterized protein (TIGR02646 family)
MRRIVKQPEPQSLTQHRANAHADYDNYQQKDELRDSLVAEQGAICCYCLRRIHPTGDGMKIEHWHCQTNYPGEQLDYGNLLGACLGGHGEPPHLQHCDTKKGDSDLARNPATAAHNIEEFIAFLPDGTIESSDPVLNDQLTPVLNLNLSILKRNRKAAFDLFIDSLAGRGTLSKRELENEIALWSSANGGRLKEYCQVVLYWLRKRLARA